MSKEKKSFSSFLQVNNIICNVGDADGKDVLEKLIVLLKRHFPALDAENAKKEVLSREEIFPTMIAPGLAVPHARITGLTEPLTAAACIPEGCEFGAPEKIKVMILLLTPIDNPGLHMQILSALAGSFVDESNISRIGRLATPDEVLKAFAGEDNIIPDYLKASDMMEKYSDLLQETDSILDAVKKFAVTRSDELPVIDNTGDLRGVLSLADLLKYSLPDHLLWLEDLSPIYQLQPFSDMLKTADETKVADVMREEFIKADIDDPAVKIAKTFLTGNLSQLIIIDHDGKPAGRITLKNFAAKLFWE